MTKITIVKGWDLPKKEYIEAYKEDKLIKLVLDFSNICNLSCDGCFTNRVEDSWTKKSKKHIHGEMNFETRKYLLEEAANLGAKSVDIVGAGEPTLDKYFEESIKFIQDLGMYPIVFTHGATKRFHDYAKEFKDSEISFFLKLWSKQPWLQNQYVRGSIIRYSKKRDDALNTLINLGYNRGEPKEIDDIKYVTTRIGADILMRKSNQYEIPELFKYCREKNILPIIKGYIPAGTTALNQENNIFENHVKESLEKDRITYEEILRIKKAISNIDGKEIKTLYPQSCKCTQSVASLYITSTGDITNCVGTTRIYSKYKPKENILKKSLKIKRTTDICGFNCPPRGLEATNPEERRKYLEESFGKLN